MTSKLVHEGFTVERKTIRLKNHLIHYTFRSIEKTISKINLHSTLRAEEKFKEGKKIGRAKIISHGLAAIFKFLVKIRRF